MSRGCLHEARVLGRAKMADAVLSLLNYKAGFLKDKLTKPRTFCRPVTCDVLKFAETIKKHLFWDSGTWSTYKIIRKGVPLSLWKGDIAPPSKVVGNVLFLKNENKLFDAGPVISGFQTQETMRQKISLNFRYFGPALCICNRCNLTLYRPTEKVHFPARVFFLFIFIFVGLGLILSLQLQGRNGN